MGKATQIFLVSSLVYLILGVSIGVMLTIHPETIGRFMPMHAHINLLGWLSMMVFAVGYHAIPRFSGKVLFSVRLANTHTILANAGLIGLMITWPLSRYSWTPAVHMILTGSAICYAAGAYLFAYNILRTILGKE